MNLDSDTIKRMVQFDESYLSGLREQLIKLEDVTTKFGSSDNIENTKKAYKEIIDRTSLRIFEYRRALYDRGEL